MTDDLVKRLRDGCVTGNYEGLEFIEWSKSNATMNEAASRIEQLETALQAMLHAVCSPTGFAAAVRTDSGKAYPWVTLEYAEKIARAALGEKKDG